MIFYFDMFVKVLVATFIWSDRLGFFEAIPCVLLASCLSAREVVKARYRIQVTRSFTSRNCLLKIASYFHFFQLNMYNLIFIYSFRCHDMDFAFLACCIPEPCKNVMLKYVEIC